MSTPNIKPVAILWFDNDPKRTLDEKIARGVAQYRSRYNRMPEVCIINPCMLPDTPWPKGQVEMYAAGVRVETKRYIMPNHFWIGLIERGQP